MAELHPSLAATTPLTAVAGPSAPADGAAARRPLGLVGPVRRWPRTGRWLAGLLPLALLAIGPWLSVFQLTLLNQIGLAALVVLGLVLLTGVAGMTSFGQAAFVGIGAYACAWLTLGQGLPGWLAPWAGSHWAALALGLAVTLCVALGLGAVTLKLSGHFLPLGTICWGLALYALFGTSEALGTHTGLSGIPPLQLMGATLDQPDELFLLIWTVLFAALLAVHCLLDSRSGRAIRALNGGQAMAASMGVPVLRMKLAAFALSALLACVSGWLYACTQRFVSPAPFSLGAGIDYLFMALIGGVGQLWGAVAGAALVTVARDTLQDLLPKLLGSQGNFEAIVFAFCVVLLMHRAPAGLWGGVQRWAAARRQPGRPAEAAAHGADGAANDTAEAAPTTAPAAPLAAHLATPLAAPPAEPLPRRRLPPAGSPVLAVQGLTRRFGGLVANRDIDLSLHAGEILAVIGPNGAGKSTLFNQLSCVDTPSAGEVRFLGRSVRGWTPQRIAAAGLSRTFQHVKLLPQMSVLDNVAIGAHLRGRRGLLASALRLDRTEEARLLAEARHQLQRVGLGAWADAEAGSLALGQQRLLEIARALCADPAVLLLDEPAAGLRHLEKQALADLLRRLRAEGLAVLLVEHDMDFVMNLVDRVAVVVFGEKIVEGLPAEVQQHPQVLEAYLGAGL